MNKKNVNRSKTYLLPLLFDSLNADTNYLHLISNTYLSDTENKYKDCIILKNKFDYDDEDFLKYEDKFINNALFIEMYNFNSYVLYVFNFPKEYISEYNSFKNSKYSLFGNDAKFLIINFWKKLSANLTNSKKTITNIENVLNKRSILKRSIEKKIGIILPDNAELGEYYNNKKETIDLRDIYKKEKDFIKS